MQLQLTEQTKKHFTEVLYKNHTIMTLLHSIILFILWTCFWSFSTVLISRWHSKKGWIMLWRSECPHCNHILGASELVPILSWMIQWGKCKNCHKKVSAYYPISECIMWIAFLVAGLIMNAFWFTIFEGTFILFLFWMFVTVIYVIYDIKYMEIPDQIMIPWIVITLLLLLAWFAWDEYIIFHDYSSYQDFHTFLTDHIIAAVVMYSFFYIQILIPGGLFLIKQKRFQDLFSLIISYILFPALIILEYFWNKSNQDKSWEEIPAWIWWGDLRIAIFIWLTLGLTHTLSTLVFSYIVWWIVWIIILTYAKVTKKKISHEIPFWPFLGIWWLLSFIFYNDILEYLEMLYI